MIMNTKPDVTTKLEVTTPRPLTLAELDEVSGAGFWSELGALYLETAITLANPYVAHKIYD
jgi:hypothetical protein